MQKLGALSLSGKPFNSSDELIGLSRRKGIMSEQHTVSRGLHRPVSPSFGWIQAFLCAAEHLDYEKTGKLLDISKKSAQERVEALEIWLNKILILDDRWSWLKTTDRNLSALLRIYC